MSGEPWAEGITAVLAETAPPVLPALPLADWPASLRAWVEAVAVSYQVPAELPAAAALGAIAAAVGGRARARVAEQWTEELALYLAVILPSGERKSAVLADAKAPIEEAERAMVEASRERVGEEQSAHRILSARAKAAETRAASAKGAADRVAAEEEARKLAGELARSAPPALPRLLADDSTPEALVGLMAEQGGALAVMSAEGGILDTLAGRYSDGVANLDAVLKAHGGEQVRVDRRGRPPEFVPRPVLTLALAVQPVVIERARANASMLGRGLLARFLYLAPETALGRRELEPPPVPAPVARAYAEHLAALLGPRAEPLDPAGPRELTLASEAGAALLALRRRIERRLDPASGDLNVISGWAGKLAGAVVRLAALLHLYEHGPDAASAIEEAPMRAAAAMAEPLAAHALAALTGPEDARQAVGRRRPGARGPAPERRGELAGRLVDEVVRVEGLTLTELAHAVGVYPKNGSLREARDELLEQGRIVRVDDRYWLPPQNSAPPANPAPRMDSGVRSSAAVRSSPEGKAPEPSSEPLTFLPEPTRRDDPDDPAGRPIPAPPGEPEDDPGWASPGPALADLVALDPGPSPWPAGAWAAEREGDS